MPPMVTAVPSLVPNATQTSQPRVSGTVRSKNPLKGAVEIISERLYYAALKAPPPSHNILASLPKRKKPVGTPAAASAEKDPAPLPEKKQVHFFNIDQELIYWNFFLDFGPLNLGQLARFSQKLNDKLRKFPVVCFYSTTLPAKRANAIYLICAWQVLYLNRSPTQAFQGFVQMEAPSEQHPSGSNSFHQRQQQQEQHGKMSDDLVVDEDLDDQPMILMNTPPLPPLNASLPPVSQSQGGVTIQPLPPFHDASPCACTYDLTVMDCLEGLTKARLHGFFDWENFDVEEYEHFEQVENGDLNWIIQNRILAFAGPSFERNVSPEGYCTLAPADYIPYFKKKGVSLVVRLNKKNYNEQDFVEAGINHVEAFFLDGSCPPMKVLYAILDAFESVPLDQAFAVHCKAGLGRTGTCIGAYIMKHYRWTAAEVIAWMRMCRPGCVIGPQQHFLKKIEPLMWQEGAASGHLRPALPYHRHDGGSSSSQHRGHAALVTPGTTPTRPSKRGTAMSPSSTLPQDMVVGDADMPDAVTGRDGQAEGLLAARGRRGRSGMESPTATTASSSHHRQQRVANTPAVAARSHDDDDDVPMMGSGGMLGCLSTPPATPSKHNSSQPLSQGSPSAARVTPPTASPRLWCG